MSLNWTVRGADPTLLFIAKNAIGGNPGIGGIVGLGVMVGVGVNVGITGFVRTHTNDVYALLPPELKAVSIGVYVPGVA